MFYIKQLKISNFRCYESCKITFSPYINILYGQNASGKTSIVEAISYLGLCKSFKNAKDDDVLKYNSLYYSIISDIENEGNTDIVVVSYVNKTKNIKKNNTVVTKLSDYLGYFNIVSFLPDDLEIVKGSPADRRRFLNINISQINKKYILTLSKYNKLLKTRNDYLKNSKSIDHLYLEALTKALIEEGKNVISLRDEFINDLNGHIEACGKTLSEGKETIKIVYKPNESIENYEKAVNSRINNDILLKTTTCGPHKDDFKVYLNDKEACLYASQGQIRSCVISLKLALSSYFKLSNPHQIVILDDVFSELDNNRQSKLLEILNNNNQIFITTTNVDNINDQILKNSNLIEVRKGESYE